MPSIRQRFHLSPCSDFRSHFFILAILREIVSLPVLLAASALATATLGYLLAGGQFFAFASINTRGLINAAVATYAFTYFIPLLRPGMVSAGLWLLILMTLATSRGKARLKRPIFLVGVASFITLLTLGRSWLGLDDVGSTLPVGVRLNGLLAYVHTGLVLGVIRMNHWRVRDFEPFFWWIMILGVFISIEAIAAFYLGLGGNIELFGTKSSSGNGLFQSVFVGNFHVVARIAMTMLFISVYFYWRRRNPLYLSVPVLAALLLFATTSRQSIVATGLGILLLVVLFRGSRSFRNLKKSEINVVLYPLITVGVFLAGVVIVALAAEARNASPLNLDSSTITQRYLLLARGLDVMAYNYGLGTGPQMYTYYSGSTSVPTSVSQHLLRVRGLTDEQLWSGVAYPDEAITGGPRGFTLHNLWVQLVIEWGAFGLAVELYLLLTFWRTYRRARRATKLLRGQGPTPGVWIIFALAVSVFFSVTFTSKFYHLEYLVLLFLFAEAWVREASSTLDDHATTTAQRPAAPRPE